MTVWSAALPLSASVSPIAHAMLFRQVYACEAPTYYRLGLRANESDRQVEFG